jgi:hypothetical protein
MFITAAAALSSYEVDVYCQLQVESLFKMILYFVTSALTTDYV